MSELFAIRFAFESEVIMSEVREYLRCLKMICGDEIRLESIIESPSLMIHNMCLHVYPLIVLLNNQRVGEEGRVYFTKCRAASLE